MIVAIGVMIVAIGVMIAGVMIGLPMTVGVRVVADQHMTVGRVSLCT